MKTIEINGKQYELKETARAMIKQERYKAKNPEMGSIETALFNVYTLLVGYKGTFEQFTESLSTEETINVFNSIKDDKQEQDDNLESDTNESDVEGK